MTSQDVIHRDPPGQPHHSCTGGCGGRPMLGQWGACGCAGGIADHTPPACGPRPPQGWCGWEFRRYLCCACWEERRADEDPAEPITRRSDAENDRREVRQLAKEARVPVAEIEAAARKYVR